MDIDSLNKHIEMLAEFGPDNLYKARGEHLRDPSIRARITATVLAENAAARAAGRPVPCGWKSFSMKQHTEKSKQKQADSMRINNCIKTPRLTDDQVREARSLYDRGMRTGLIAEKFGVSQPLMSQVVHGKTYKQVI